MNYSFDTYGWYSKVEIPSRTTEVIPPKCDDTPSEGELYPNFTGYEWILMTYIIPPTPMPEPTPEPTPEPIIIYKHVLTPLEFLNRFNDDELISIISLSKTNVQLELWWTKYNKAKDMDLDDPQTIAGVQALESFGLIGTGRVSEILTKYPI
jgi:hypothetical protein